MVTYGDTDVKFVKLSVTSQEMGAVDFGQMNILIYFILVSRHPKTYNIPLTMSMEEISNYFEIIVQNKDIQKG